MLSATVNVDASWCPKTRASGWASWVSVDGRKIKQSGAFKNPPKSSNQAEFWATVNGCYVAVNAGARLLLVQSDCVGALSLIADGRQSPVKKLMKLYPEIVIRTKWVKGHSDVPGARSWVNRWCDQEARKYMKQQRKLVSA